jgi:hypothetical protein
MVVDRDGARIQDCAGESQQQFTRRSSQKFWFIYIVFEYQCPYVLWLAAVG